MKNNDIINAKLIGLTTFIHLNFRIEFEGKEYVCKLREPSDFYKLRDYVMKPITLRVVDITRDPMVVELC